MSTTTRLAPLQGGTKAFAIALALLCISALALSAAFPAIAKPPESDEDGSRGRGKGHGRGPPSIHGSHQGGTGDRPAPRGEAKGLNLSIERGWTLNITATGTAIKITDPSMTKETRVTFNATVEKSSMRRAKLEVTVGNLNISKTIYSIEKGKGLIALRCGKLIVHLEVIGPDGTKLHVVLKGELIEPLPETFDIDDSVRILFEEPQSKLAAKFFLDLVDGTLTRVE